MLNIPLKLKLCELYFLGNHFPLPDNHPGKVLKASEAFHKPENQSRQGMQKWTEPRGLCHSAELIISKIQIAGTNQESVHETDKRIGFRKLVNTKLNLSLGFRDSSQSTCKHLLMDDSEIPPWLFSSFYKVRLKLAERKDQMKVEKKLCGENTL